MPRYSSVSNINNDVFYTEFFFLRVYTYVLFFKEDSVWISRQLNSIPCPNAQLSKHHSSKRWELSVPTFLCVEKLWTALKACIRPDVLAARPNSTQCSISYGISFQNTDMGRQLQPSRLLVFVLAAFCWTKSLLCNVAAFRDAALSRVYSSAMFFEKILWSFQGFISVPCQPSGRRGIPSRRSSVSNICSDDEIFPSGRPSVSRSFEQFKIASVRT
jgi:hypothetical protein